MKNFFIWLVVGIICTPIWGGEQPLVKKVVYRAHDGLSYHLRRFMSGIDEFFSRKASSAEKNESQLQVSYTSTKVEGEEVFYTPQVRLKIHLPETQKRLMLVFEHKSEEEGFEQYPENTQVGKEAQKEVKTTGALSYLLKPIKKWNFIASAGIKVDIPPEPFAKIQAFRDFKAGRWLIKPDQSFFYFLDDGFSEKTQLDFDRRLNRFWLFRLVNSETWTDEQDTFYGVHGPSIFHKLSDRRGLSYHAHLKTISRPLYMINSYDFSIVYRQNLMRTWFFYELTPAISFPRDRDWERVHSISLKLEMLI